MIRLGCLIARAGHAERCPRCRVVAAQDRAMRAVATAAGTPGLSPRARDDAFARGLARAAVVPAPRWRPLLVPAAVALAAAAAIVVVIATRDAAAPAPAPRALAAGTSTVGHGRVTLSPGGVAWQTGATEVTLVAGSVEVEVDPALHRGFRVRARWFTVDVLGTVFTVDLESVAVHRGAVRISAPTGAVLVDQLAAGERWTLAPETAEVAPPPATAGSAAPDEPAEIAMSPDDGRAHAGAGHVTAHPPTAGSASAAPPVSADRLLAAARTQIADGDAAAGRKTVATLLALAPGRKIRAEAEALVADSYKDENLATAIERYRAVADTYRDLATGEAALYTAARLSAKAGRTADAHALYETYVARYPGGALADKARAALEQR